MTLPVPAYLRSKNSRSKDSRPQALPLLLRAMAAVLFAFALLGAPAGPASAQPVGSFADLAERLSPAVVNIATAQTVEQPQRNGQGAPEGSPFDDLFRDFFENGQPRAPQTVQSLGSGFVISPIYLTKDTREPIRGKSGSKGPRPSLS